jgi:N-acylneuraminate cytidylyltransferase
MSATCLILARRGSKGVPGKNMAIVAGRPCLAWTIDDAFNSREASRVLLSTDWPEAAMLARSMGCEVIDRPDSLAGDTATVDDAARHALPEGSTRGPIAILYANVPVRPAGLIDSALRRMREHGDDAVQSFAPVGKHHPWWTARIDERTGRVRPWDGDRLFHGVYRRQALPAAFVPDGGVLVVTPEALHLRLAGVPEGPHAFLGREERRGAVLTIDGEVVDIDSPTDLVVADVLLRARQRAGRGGIGGGVEGATRPACTGAA